MKNEKIVIVLGLVITILCHQVRLSAGQLNLSEKDSWATDGRIYRIALENDIAYMVGEFDKISPYIGHGVPVDIHTGKPVAEFPKVYGKVHAVASDTSGGWYIGGEFIRVGELKRNHLAHILSDGTVDPVWNPNPDGIIQTLAATPTAIYVGGDFNHIGGQSRLHVAAVDSERGNATQWHPNTDISAKVYTLAVDGQTIYLGGNFQSIGGKTRHNIAALDTSLGTATDWDPDANGFVQTLAVSNSVIYIGGNFATVGGQPHNRLAALDKVTGSPTQWNPSADNLVQTIEASQTTVYIGGYFRSINGQPRHYLAALDTAAGNPTDWNPDPDLAVLTLKLDGSILYTGGYFSRMNGLSHCLVAALDTKTGNVTNWDPKVFGNFWDTAVRALALSGSTLYIGGRFGGRDGVARKNIAAIDQTTGKLTDFNPRPDSVVNSLAVSSSVLYITGIFSAVNGQPRHSLAAIDTLTGKVLDWNPDPNAIVSDFKIMGSTVYVGGLFSRISGKTRYGLAALDATTGNASDWAPSTGGKWGGGGEVNTLSVQGSTVYVGGFFTSINGKPRNGIGAVDATTGMVTTWDPNPSAGLVYALDAKGPFIYVGGQFTSIGGKPRSCIAALDAETGTATDWNPSADGFVANLVAQGSLVYAIGGFHNLGGYAALDAASGKPTDWTAFDWTTGATGLGLAATNNFLLLGGQFLHKYEIPKSLLRDSAPPIITLLAPADQSAISRTIIISANASDNVGVQGVQFKLDGQNLGSEISYPPYKMEWNTVNTSNGAHSLSAVARDATENTATSSVTVIVNNNAPSVTLSSPKDGSTVESSIEISATGSDDTAIEKVELWANEALAATQVLNPPQPSFSVTFNYPMHTSTARLQVKAYNTSGLVGLSNIVNITRENKKSSPVSLVKANSLAPQGVVTANDVAEAQGKSRALLVSPSSGFNQSLLFSEDVREAKVIRLNGAKRLEAQRNGAGPLVITLQEMNGSLGLESGLYIIQTRTDLGDLKNTPLLVVK
ncbi:MAG: hypothetical protein HY399_07955 [Elusimicrobia bacterium]|nr:hypothetical protein [Elusimicrobiota bacterium]